VYVCVTLSMFTCYNDDQVMSHWPLALKPITCKALPCANSLIVCKARVASQSCANAMHAMHVGVVVSAGY